MSSEIENRYAPDYVSPPGETLEEIVQEKGITQAELADRMGRPKKTINEIIKGKAAITPETALQLELVLGVPASFWNKREQLYREYLARKSENQRLQEQIGWLKTIPYQQMAKRGWINSCQNKVEQLREVLNFFSVTSPKQWEEIWGKNLSVDFRKSQAFDSDHGAITAWLRRGELEAAEIDCVEYNANQFKKTLDEIRALTIKSPETFQPEIRRLCANAGVAVVFIPEIPMMRVCGATLWLNPHKALIQLSLRYKTDDHFWFAFFHEAGHILLHGKRDVFLEIKDGESTNNKEEEANNFAANLLISPAKWKQFKESSYHTKEAIKKFAREIGIAPGIVVGRLQYEGKLPYSQYNDLKQRLDINVV